MGDQVNKYLYETRFIGSVTTCNNTYIDDYCSVCQRTVSLPTYLVCIWISLSDSRFTNVIIIRGVD